MTALPEVPRYVVGAMHLTHADDRGSAQQHERYVVLHADHLTAMQQQRDTALREALAEVTPWLPHATDCNVRHYAAECDCECSNITDALQRLIDGGDTHE